MTPQELRARTREFAVRTKRFCRPLIRDLHTADPARQLARASASVAANYQSTCVARSPKEFASRIGVVLEEADECVYWTRYLRECGMASPELEALSDEAHQLAKIFNKSYHTAKRRAESQ
jgi:four helix bundle protein